MSKIILGTDVSIATCINEGYLMIEGKEKDLEGPFSLDTRFHFGCVVGGLQGYSETFSDKWTFNLLSINSLTENHFVEGTCSLRELLDTYRENDSIIDNAAGTTFPTRIEGYQDIQDVLNLASTIEAVLGVNYLI